MSVTLALLMLNCFLLQTLAVHPSRHGLPAPHLDSAFDVVLKNAHNSLSIKDLAQASRVNKGFLDMFKEDPSWRYVKAIMKEPCFTAFADNAYYVPSTRTNPEHLLFKFTEWSYDETKLDGEFNNGVRWLAYQPDFSKQQVIAECFDRLLAVNLKFKVITSSKPDLYHYPLSDGYYKFKNDLDMVKHWMLWFSIQKNHTHLLDYLLAPEQETPITSRHFEEAAKQNNEDVFRKLLEISDPSSTPSWRLSLSNMFELWDPTPAIIDLLLQIVPLRPDDFEKAALYRRLASLKHLIQHAPQHGIQEQQLPTILIDAYSHAVAKCEFSTMHILNEYNVQPYQMEKRSSFGCALIRRDKIAAKEYFYRFNLRTDVMQWLVYFSNDERLSPAVQKLVNTRYDLQDDKTVETVIDQLMDLSLKDIRTFGLLNVLLYGDGISVSPNNKLALIFELQRGNLKRAAMYYKVFRFEETSSSFYHWAPFMSTEHYHDLLSITKTPPTRFDVFYMVHLYSLSSVHMVAWAITNLNHWSERDFDYFDNELVQLFSDNVRDWLRGLIRERRNGFVRHTRKRPRLSRYVY